MVPTRILVVDDEQGMLEVCAASLKKLPGATILVEQDSRRAAGRLARESFDLLIADICMPHVNGVELLRAAKQADPNLGVLMITAFPTVETAVETMKLGAADYITKPFRPEELLAVVTRLLETKQLRDENRLLQRQVDRTYAFGDMIGNSTAIQAVFETIKRVAETDVDVLILGETGTGKELVARSVHQHSSRSTQRFVPVDCGAIPEDLLESELFGHEKGSFTGATERRVGKFELANKGTAFLDEIGDMPVNTQAKILRVLETGEIERVGGHNKIPVELRIVAATNQNIHEKIEQGQFRQDLFFRINTFTLVLPPLRERREDLISLAQHFLDLIGARRGGGPRKCLSHSAQQMLLKYNWPGNVRELRNVMERAAVLTESNLIGPEALPEEVLAESNQLSLPPHDSQPFSASVRNGSGIVPLKDLEKRAIIEALSLLGFNATQTAKNLGISKATLYRKIKEYNISRRLVVCS